MLSFRATIVGKRNTASFYHLETNHDLFRGVRSVEISMNDSEWRKALKEVTKDTNNEKDMLIRMIVVGVDDKGNKFSKMWYYFKSDIKEGKRFVSIRKGHYDTEWYEKYKIDYLRHTYFNQTQKCSNTKGILDKKDCIEIFLEYYHRTKAW